MKIELDLLETQQCLLKCMQSIDQCCRDNGISYSLDFGSLLGAVRHKGFIPWDDDMDLLMTRINYNRFIQCYDDPSYEVISGDTKYWGAHFIRICDKGTEVKWNDPPEYEKTVSHGLWVAVFPVDNAPSDEKDWIKLQNGFKFYSECIRLKRGMWAPSGFFRNIIKALIRICLKPFSYKCLVKLQDKCLTQYNKFQTGFSYQKGLYFRRYPTSYFDKYIDIEFEGNTFMAISEYDKYLTYIYGNYMTPPPVSERVPKHEYKAYKITD